METDRVWATACTIIAVVAIVSFSGCEAYTKRLFAEHHCRSLILAGSSNVQWDCSIQ